MKKRFFLLLFLMMCVLPRFVLAGSWGLIRVPVASLHADADFSAEIVTQSIAGTPVRVLDEKDWKKIQTPDGYIGWIHRDQIILKTTDELGDWNKSEKVVVTALQSAVMDKLGQPVTLLPASAHVRYLGQTQTMFHVALPDGRVGFLPQTDAQLLTDFQNAQKQLRTNHPQAAIADMIKDAKSLNGRSYLWAGASTFAMDCSGFVQTVWRMNDLIVPRDAGQQAQCGNPWIWSDGSVPNLKAGDLLFFGKKEEKVRISHVGISLGGARFIHSLGDVHTASLNPADMDYDEREAARYLGARTLSFKDDCVTSTIDNGFYQNPPREL